MARPYRANSATLRGSTYHIVIRTGSLRPKVLVWDIGCAGLHGREHKTYATPCCPLPPPMQSQDVGNRIKAWVLTPRYALAIVKQPAG
jgi:hypothetical protein